MQPLLAPPPTPGERGFSCKTWLARTFEERYRRGHHFVWFSSELNPILNGDSSNPLWLYLTLDRAVKLRDANHPKITAVRYKLLQAVKKVIGPGDRRLLRELKREIRAAPIEMYRPQIWSIDVANISPPRIDAEQANPNWDEALVRDLKQEEFCVIVE